MSGVRIHWGAIAPDARKAMVGLERYVRACGLEGSLLELVKTRASMMNGCAYCIDMHTKDARVEGESEQRLYGLAAWRETPYYTARERAALAWAEAVTDLTKGHVGDDVYHEARAHFTEQELVDLTMVVVTINGWNRLAVSMRTEAGTYQPGQM